MSDLKATPKYLMPAGSPVVKQFDDYFKLLQQNSDKHIQMNVWEEIVTDGEVGLAHHFLVALQHNPQFLSKCILSVGFNFFLGEENTIELPELSWKTNPAYQQWFFKMNSLPAWIFFLHDRDARFYCLAGDMLSERAIPSSGTNGDKSMLQPTPEQAQILSDRLFHSCWFMMLYCHGTGVDAKPYIEALIADFGLFFTAEQVYEKYEADIKRGIELMAK